MKLLSWLRNSPRHSRPASQAHPRFEALEDRCLLSAGQLDPAFGGGGGIRTDVAGASADNAFAMTVNQADGKIVEVGTYSFWPAPGGGLAVTRHNADGSLDATFGSGGKALFSESSPQWIYPGAVAVDGAGRILVAGRASQLLRLNADGSPDFTFGQDGRANLPIPGEIEIARVTVDGHDRVVVAATVLNTVINGESIGRAMVVARLTPQGGIDTGFGASGLAVVRFIATRNYDDQVRAVAVDAADRIILAGSTVSSSGGTGYDFAVARLKSDGTLDAGFGNGGKTTVDLGGAFNFSADVAAGVAIDYAGRIVVGGSTAQYQGSVVSGLSVARLNADGSLDTDYGTEGKSTVWFGSSYFSVTATALAFDAVGRAAVVGSGFDADASTLVALFRPDGGPDATFGLGGKVVDHTGTFYPGGAAFDPAGGLVVAGTNAATPGNIDFGLMRYFARDLVVAAGSPTLAAELQAAVTAVRTAPPAVTPRVVIHVASQAQMAATVAAIAGLPANPSGPVVEILLDVDAGSYRVGSVSVPPGLQMLLDGDGGYSGVGTFASTSGPVLTLLAGEVLIRDGAVLSGAPKAVVIDIQGGRLSLQQSTLNAVADGRLIRLTGADNLNAVGTLFELDGVPLSDGFQIEDLIDHSLDGLRGGTVYWVPGNVFVTKASKAVQRGVDVVADSGTVNVQNDVHGDYYVGNRSLTIRHESGTTITQQADSMDPTKRSLTVTGGFYADNKIRLTTGSKAGEVQVHVNNLAHGTFLPTGRLVVYGGYGGNSDIEVDSRITLPAWLFASYYDYGSSNRLKGGGGDTVLVGSSGDDKLIGGDGRNLIIGNGGADRLSAGGGDSLLIAGSTYWTSWTSDEAALAAVMREWTRTGTDADYASRVGHLLGTLAGGLNGGTFLDGSTVYDDGSIDVLTGGSSLDWFVLGSSDRVTGRQKNEIVTSV